MMFEIADMGKMKLSSANPFCHSRSLILERTKVIPGLIKFELYIIGVLNFNSRTARLREISLKIFPKALYLFSHPVIFPSIPVFNPELRIFMKNKFFKRKLSNLWEIAWCTSQPLVLFIMRKMC